jgi:hypothetical protein
VLVRGDESHELRPSGGAATKRKLASQTARSETRDRAYLLQRSLVVHDRSERSEAAKEVG